MQVRTTAITSSTLPHNPPHRPPPLSPTAQPKPSPGGPVLGFWPKTRNPGLRSPTHNPATAVTSSTPPHHLPPSPTTAVSNGAPQTEPVLGF